MDIRLLGPVEAYARGQRVDLGPRKQRFVFAVLALEVNHQVPVERLIELTWPVRPPRTAMQAIQVCVSRLRAALATGPVEIGTRGTGYVLEAPPESIDAHRFRSRLTEAAATTDDADKVALLTGALDLWSGTALSGAVPPETQERLCGGLEEARLTAIEDRADAQLRLGQHCTLLQELIPLVTAHPIRDRMLAQLMLAFYRSGQAGAALDVYRQARQRLADEFGLDPGTELRRLELAILRNDPSLDPPPGTAPVATVRAIPQELPPDVYGFTGRDRQREELDRLLDGGDSSSAVAIAALCGMGGVGKTALAVHWAHRVADRFPDGQLYIDLRGYDPDPPLAAAQALAGLLSSLGVTAADMPADDSARAARYRSLLAGRRVLLVLDNAWGAEQVRPLLPGSATCFVVVTSRDRLAGLVARNGARRVALDVLPASEAVNLLCTLAPERMDADPAAALSLAERCAYLPLALRIAAEIACARPDAGLSTLVDELTCEQRRLDVLDAGTDQQTAVRSVLSWSERHLPAAAKRLFWLFGVQPGRSLDGTAAAALAGTDPDEARSLIAALARAHLLERAGVDRWSMHDLLRAYAAERCVAQLSRPEWRSAVSGLLDHYRGRAAAAMDTLHPVDRHRHGESRPGLTFADTGEARRWLDAERFNLVAAAVHAAGNGWPERAIGLAEVLGRYLEIGYHNADAITVHTRALQAAKASGDRAAQAAALHELGLAHARSGHYDKAIDRYRSALAGYRELADRAGEAATLRVLGLAYSLVGEYRRALVHYRQALHLCRQIGERAGEGRVLSNIGRLHWWQGRHREAVDHFQEAVNLLRVAGDRSADGRATDLLGTAYERWGRYTEAHDRYQQALRIVREVGDHAAEACALTDLGRIYRRWGRYTDAFEHHQRALTMFQEMGDRIGQTEALIDLAAAHYHVGRPDQALQHYQQAYGIASDLGDRRLQIVALNGQGRALHATGESDQALDVHRSALRQAVDVGDRDEQAGALDGIAQALYVLDQPGAARQYWQQALVIYRELDLPEAYEVRARLADASDVLLAEPVAAP